MDNNSKALWPSGVVQAWASDPATNYGMIFKMGNKFATGQ
jgi:hypothetical protein